MSDDVLSRPLVDPAARRRRLLWIVLAVALTLVALVVAHLM